MAVNVSLNKIIRPEILRLKAYISPCFEHRIKLDLNESPFDLPNEIKNAVFERARGLLWQRYHDEFEEPLKVALGEYLGHDPRGILIGNGSNELIFHILLSAARAGEAVVYPEPSFSLYRQNVLVLGGLPARFRLQAEDFSIDPAGVIDLAREKKAAAVVLCSPNNPTGNRVPNQVIEEIARSLDTVIALDEAYVQFAGDNAQGLLKSCPNLIILRTFSKAFGLASLRFGYGISDPGLAGEIAKVQLPHHVNFFTQVTALTLLERPGVFEKRVEKIKKSRDKLQEELARLPGIRVFPSEANFILIECREKTPAEVFEGLLSLGILVRNISNYPGLEKHLRITVGNEDDNKKLLAALGEVLA